MDTVGDAGKIKGRKRKEVKTAGCCVCGGSEEGPVSATLNWEKGTPLYEGNGTKKKKNDAKLCAKDYWTRNSYKKRGLE